MSPSLLILIAATVSHAATLRVVPPSPRLSLRVPAGIRVYQTSRTSGYRPVGLRRPFGLAPASIEFGALGAANSLENMPASEELVPAKAEVYVTRGRLTPLASAQAAAATRTPAQWIQVYDGGGMRHQNESSISGSATQETHFGRPILSPSAPDGRPRAAVMIPAAAVAILIPTLAAAAGVEPLAPRTASGIVSIYWGIGFVGTLLTTFGLSFLKLGSERRRALSPDISRWTKLFAVYAGAVALRAAELLGYVDLRAFLPEGIQLGQLMHLAIFLPLVYGLTALATHSFLPAALTRAPSFPVWIKAILPLYVASEIAVHHANSNSFWVHIICGSFNLFCVSAAIFEGIRRTRKAVRLASTNL